VLLSQYPASGRLTINEEGPRALLLFLGELGMPCESILRFSTLQKP
jgi:hypothetical protein